MFNLCSSETSEKIDFLKGLASGLDMKMPDSLENKSSYYMYEDFAKNPSGAVMPDGLDEFSRHTWESEIFSSTEVTTSELTPSMNIFLAGGAAIAISVIAIPTAVKGLVFTIGGLGSAYAILKLAKLVKDSKAKKQTF